MDWLEKVSKYHEEYLRFLQAMGCNSHAEDIINTKFKNVFPDWTVDFPLKGPHSLGGEVYILHQLEGETEPTQVDFVDYMENDNDNANLSSFFGITE